MSNPFRVGDLVRCVDMRDATELQYGAMYCITSVNRDGFHVTVEGPGANETWGLGYWHWRFVLERRGQSRGRETYTLRDGSLFPPEPQPYAWAKREIDL